MQQGRRSDDGRDSVETLGVGLRAKEEVQGEILDHHEEQGLLKELHEGGGQEVPTRWYDTSQNVGSACSRDGSYDGSYGKIF